MTSSKKDGASATINVGLAGAATDVVSRYGRGVKEHFVAYGGIDNETGQRLKRGLKQISHSKVNPKYRDTNLKQQAGFSAEIKEVARRRAEEAISGKKPTTMRTDDIPGHVNDPLFDISSKVDAAGNPVPGSSAQMKFVGASPEAAVGKMLGKKYQKYIDNDCKMLVPSDYYDGMKAELEERISSLEEQVERLKSSGKADAAAKMQAKLDKCRTLEKNLRKSKVSNKEAMEARTSPKLSTAKDITKASHGAGMDQAKIGAAIGGGISIVRNVIAMCHDGKSFTDAAKAIAADTAEAGAVSYATGFVGALVKGALQNSKSAAFRSASKTGLPAMVATSALEVGKSLKRYMSGEIDGVQCLDELGEKGCGMLTAGMFTAIGQVAIPIPVVGAMIGSMAGYALSSSCYRELVDSLKEAKLSRMRRVRIERECAEMADAMQKFRKALDRRIEKHLQEKRMLFDSAFTAMKSALEIGDVDGYIASTNRITAHFGKKPLYASMVECNALMESDMTIRI